MLGQVLGRKRPAPFLSFDHLDEGSGASSSSRHASERVNQEVHNKPGGQNASNNSDAAVPNPTQRRRLLRSRMIDRGKDGRRGRLRNGRTARSQANTSSDHDELSDVECAPDRYTTYDLAWNQCTECQKWRLTTVAALRKPLWTCKNEFWSNRLVEWKVGCGWSQDKTEEQLKSGELYLGAPVANHQMLNQAASKQLSKREARNKAEDNQSSRIIKDDDKDTNLGGSSNAPILIVRNGSRAFTWAGTDDVSRDDDVLRELADKQADAAAAAVLAFQAATAAAALNPVHSTELAKPKRGRPLGSVTRPKRDTTPQTTTVGVPSPRAIRRVYPTAPEGTTIPSPTLKAQSSLDQELALGGYVHIGMPGGLMSIKPNDIFPNTNILTTTVASQMGMMVPPVVQAINPPQEPRCFAPIHGRQKPSQQQQFQCNVAIHFKLIPAVEQIMANLPIQYWPNLQLVLNILRVEHPHPQDIVLALAALRVIVAPYPLLVQLIDCITQHYPVLQMPQQSNYF